MRKTTTKNKESKKQNKKQQQQQHRQTDNKRRQPTAIYIEWIWAVADTLCGLKLKDGEYSENVQPSVNWLILRTKIERPLIILMFFLERRTLTGTLLLPRWRVNEIGGLLVRPGNNERFSLMHSSLDKTAQSC